MLLGLFEGLGKVDYSNELENELKIFEDEIKEFGIAKPYDFPQFEKMLRVLGAPEDIIESRKRGLNEQFAAGALSESQIFDMEKHHAVLAITYKNMSPTLLELNRASFNEYSSEYSRSAGFQKTADLPPMNSIELIFNFGDKNIVKGSSKFGGKPDVWDGFEWIRTVDPDNDPEYEPQPLVFACQINLAEISAYDKDGLLPENGMLYFFTSPYGDDFGDNFRVVYYGGDLSELKPCSYPEDYYDEHFFPDVPLTFQSVESNPGNEFSGSGIRRHKLLGYADAVQNDVLDELSDLDEGEEWSLLFQLDYIEPGDFEGGQGNYLMYGDAGRVYFCIKKSDLAKCDFSGVQVVLQCH